MSKVWEDEEIRNATEEEQEQIDQQGGGGSSRFELIETKEITTPVSRVSFDISGYDEFLIKSVATGSTQSSFNVQIETNNNNKFFNIANGFNTTEKTVYCRIFRLSPSVFEYKFGGDVNDNKTIEIPNTTGYEDLLKTLIVAIAGSGNTIQSGTIKVYGRKLTNE